MSLLNFQQALACCADNASLAHKLLDTFIKQIDEHIHHISVANQQQQINALQNHIHKLHGACQYIGAPRLKRQLEQLDGHLSQYQEAERNRAITDIIAMLKHIQQQSHYDENH